MNANEHECSLTLRSTGIVVGGYLAQLIGSGITNTWNLIVKHADQTRHDGEHLLVESCNTMNCEQAESRPWIIQCIRPGWKGCLRFEVQFKKGFRCGDGYMRLFIPETLDQQRQCRRGVRTRNSQRGNCKNARQQVRACDQGDERWHRSWADSPQAFRGASTDLLVLGRVRDELKLWDCRISCRSEDAESGRSEVSSACSGIVPKTPIAEVRWDDRPRQPFKHGNQQLLRLRWLRLVPNPIQQKRQRICPHSANCSLRFFPLIATGKPCPNGEPHRQRFAFVAWFVFPIEERDHRGRTDAAQHGDCEFAALGRHQRMMEVLRD